MALEQYVKSAPGVPSAPVLVGSRRHYGSDEDSSSSSLANWLNIRRAAAALEPFSSASYSSAGEQTSYSSARPRFDSSRRGTTTDTTTTSIDDGGGGNYDGGDKNDTTDEEISFVWRIDEDYPDHDFFSLINATATAFNISSEDVLEILGRFFLEFTRCIFSRPLMDLII